MISVKKCIFSVTLRLGTLVSYLGAWKDVGENTEMCFSAKYVVLFFLIVAAESRTCLKSE